MDLESVKRLLENGQGTENESSINSLPTRLFDPFILQGLHVDLVEPGRLICSMKVPPRLLNNGNFLHGGATASLVDLVGSAAIFSTGAPISGVSVEINVSYLDAAYADIMNWFFFSLMPDYSTIPYAHLAISPFFLALCSLSYIMNQEEIEIECKVLRVGKSVGVVSVEIRKKKTGKIIAQGRHTKYLLVRSKI
uniref:Thioesterase domain-containing protein n=1 Tax=Vitis vinifera TaxID=29760 RepID=A5BZ07_VITVI|nr:hypothetical protein VITISV_011380 [Vitis vinifera]